MNGNPHAIDSGRLQAAKIRVPEKSASAFARVHGRSPARFLPSLGRSSLGNRGNVAPTRRAAADAVNKGAQRPEALTGGARLLLVGGGRGRAAAGAPAVARAHLLALRPLWPRLVALMQRVRAQLARHQPQHATPGGRDAAPRERDNRATCALRGRPTTTKYERVQRSQLKWTSPFLTTGRGYTGVLKQTLFQY